MKLSVFKSFLAMTILSLFLVCPGGTVWAATGDCETVAGKTDTAITSIMGVAGTGIATIMGKNYTDGDAVGETCTGSLVLIAHFENSDTITTGTPAGCSALGDTTWALGGSAAYTADAATGSGSYSVNFPTDSSSADQAVITTPDASGVWEGSAGRLDFYMKISALPAAERGVIAVYSTSDNFVRTDLNADGELVVRHYATFARTLTTANCNMETGVWYHIIIKWREGTDDPSLSATCGENTETINDNLYSWSGTDPANIDVGKHGGYSFDGQVDYLRVYTTWAD